jgi:hypothetical protein
MSVCSALNEHEGMVVGIHQFRTERDLRLDQMLIQPMRAAADTYPINERGLE